MVDFVTPIFGLIFIFGLAVGSFLNVLIYRLPQGLSLFGRSLCPKCRGKISWYDNIPLVSYFLLGGKCRKCHSPIGWQYPIVELTTGVLFLLIAFLFPSGLLALFYYLFIISSLIVVFFTDLRYGIIPDKIVYPATIISLIYIILNTKYLIQNSLFSAVGATLFLGSFFLITRGRGMGLGDVKLAFLLGLFLGFPKIIPAFYLAFLTGAAVSSILILAGKKRFGQTISFGPFLVFGTILVFFFHEKILAFFPWLYFS